jgi:hypothetical protein
MLMHLPLTGRCQCTQFGYRITSAPMAVYACHCTECQRQSGSAFSLSLVVARDCVRIDHGQKSVWVRHHESGRVIDCVLCRDARDETFSRTARKSENQHSESRPSR